MQTLTTCESVIVQLAKKHYDFDEVCLADAVRLVLGDAAGIEPTGIKLEHAAKIVLRLYAKLVIADPAHEGEPIESALFELLSDINPVNRWGKTVVTSRTNEPYWEKVIESLMRRIALVPARTKTGEVVLSLPPRSSVIQELLDEGIRPSKSGAFA